MLVDIGGGTTNIAVFTDGAAWHTKVIDVGAGHFTSDLAMVLRLPMETAERLKITYGHANPDEVPHDHPLAVSGFGDQGGPGFGGVRELEQAARHGLLRVRDGR